MSGTQTPASPTNAGQPAECKRVAIQFSIDGDLRFISHRDEMRLLARALRRARWPVAHSQGFNPQPRLVLPLPRRVGYASKCEWAVVELTEWRATEELHESLAAEFTPTCHLRRVVALTTRAKPHPRRTLYTIELEREHAEQAAGRITQLMEAERLPIERTYGPGKPPRTIDIRPYIETVTLGGCTLSMQLSFVDQRSARPTEVLTALNLLATAYNHRVRRVEVEWDFELAGPTSARTSTERNNVGQEEDCPAQAQERDAQE